MSKVWRYGDHIDTDVIIPARYLNIADFKELAEHAMEDAKENLEIKLRRQRTARRLHRCRQKTSAAAPPVSMPL